MYITYWDVRRRFFSLYARIRTKCWRVIRLVNPLRSV